MMTTIELELQSDLLEFVEACANELNCKREEVIAEAIKLLRAEREMEKGYRNDKEEIVAFAESAIPLFPEVRS